MGYLLRGLRVASYLAAALGLILAFLGTNNNALLYYGVRLLVIGLIGIGATALLRDTYLEGVEEEEYNSLHPTSKLKALHLPQLKTPKLPAVTSKAVLPGGIAGFIGVLVGSYYALGWNLDDSGAGIIFWILTCLGYPVLSAFLGGVCGIYATFFLTRYVDEDLFHEVDFITRIIVGFVVGVLAGIGPFIVINWVDKIYWQ